MSGLSSQSLRTVWGRSLHRGLVLKSRIAAATYFSNSIRLMTSISASQTPPVRLVLPRLHIPNDQDQKQTGYSGGSVQNAKDCRQGGPGAKEADDHLDSRQTVAISRTTSASSKRSPQLSFAGQMRAPE
jgi:hypothetical protein